MLEDSGGKIQQKSTHLHFQTMSSNCSAHSHSTTGTQCFLFWTWAEVVVPKVFLIDQENHSEVTKSICFQYTK